MSAYLNMSAGPHARSRLSTGNVMRDVCIALLPATVVGVWHFGLNALLTVLASVTTAVLTEYLFDRIAKRGATWRDGSAVVTGLLLALCLPPTVPLYIPILGSLFAILFVKCFFGGLGKNFMNPALAGRCFLLISFSSTMTNYKYVDAVSSATPLVSLANGEKVNLLELFLGSGSVTGVIGCSAAALLAGGIYLLAIRAITWEIPVAALAVFTLFIAIFGGHGFSPAFLLANLMGGGILMGSFFMATDPVTSPVTSPGQLIFGAAVGLLAAIFRVFGSSADSVSYAIIISNLLTPLLDEFVVPLPFGLRKGAKEGSGKSSFSASMLRPAVKLTLITLLAGVGLAAVFNLTKDTISEQKLQKQIDSYLEVLPGATEIEENDALKAAVASLEGKNYGTSFGKIKINDAVQGLDGSGSEVGYAVNVTTGDGFDGNITMTIGLAADGTVKGISFTEINETAGMGMRCKDPEFKDQFTGRKVESFLLNKSGDSSGENEIDSVSGASISSQAVVNAVNAALDFLRSHVNG